MRRRSAEVTYSYYVKSDAGALDFLVVTTGTADDKYATDIFSQIPMVVARDGLSICALTDGKFGFEALLIAPPAYPGQFKGRLDSERQRLFLCIPIHRCEFSGDEQVGAFVEMYTKRVPVWDWNREVHPRIGFRFDNPKTGSGTGDDYVLAGFALVSREIDNLHGVTGGFLEILNFRKEVVEVVAQADGKYILIPDRDDTRREAVDRPESVSRLCQFLTVGARR